jgi:hypothetical protein
MYAFSLFFCCVCYIVYSFFLLGDTMLLLEVCQSVMRYLLFLLVGYICDFAMEGRIVVNLLTNSFPFEFICKATIGCILLLPLALIYGQKTGKDCLASQGLGCNFLYHYYELRIPTNWLCCLFIYPPCQPLLVYNCWVTKGCCQVKDPIFIGKLYIKMVPE